MTQGVLSGEFSVRGDPGQCLPGISGYVYCIIPPYGRLTLIHEQEAQLTQRDRATLI